MAARFAMLALTALLAGCAHWGERPADTLAQPVRQADGQVDARTLDAPSSERYRMATDGRFLSPTRVSRNPLPRYPDSLLARRLPPAEVRIRVVVDADGVVTGASRLGEVGRDWQPFVDAAIAAVLGWRFAPLYMTDEQGRWQKMPFHQDYAFTFTQVDGKGGVVESAR